MAISIEDLQTLSFTELSELIALAETVRVEREANLREEIEQKARLLGLELHVNGKVPRKRRTRAQSNHTEQT